MIHHYITKYAEDGTLWVESWMQLNLFGRSFCFSRKKIALRESMDDEMFIAKAVEEIMQGSKEQERITAENISTVWAGKDGANNVGIFKADDEGHYAYYRVTYDSTKDEMLVEKYVPYPWKRKRYVTFYPGMPGLKEENSYVSAERISADQING